MTPGFGGEALSLALNHSDKAAFASAGYADLQGASYGAAGKVRQHGRLSFTRVFDAGHQGRQRGLSPFSSPSSPTFLISLS